MSITFDVMPPRAPRRSASVPTSESLLNRIQKPPLAERLSRDDSIIKAPSGPCVHFYVHYSLFPAYLTFFPFPFFLFRRAFTGGPVRNRPSRGSGSGNANGTTRAPKGPKKPKTAAELDQELDAFMGDADAVSAGDAALVVGDVNMA